MLGTHLDTPRVVTAVGVAVVALGLYSCNGFVLGLFCTLWATLLTAYVIVLQQNLFDLVASSKEEHYVLYQQLETVLLHLEYNANLNRHYRSDTTVNETVKSHPIQESDSSSSSDFTSVPLQPDASSVVETEQDEVDRESSDLEQDGVDRESSDLEQARDQEEKEEHTCI